MGIKFANNASTNITHALTADATSVSVTPGTGDLFPSLVEGKDYFYATLAGNNGLEIVKVTKRVLDTMTVERAQDGTPALVFNRGDLFELRIVAADFEDTFSHVETMLEDTVDQVDSRLEDNITQVNSIVEDSIEALDTSVVHKTGEETIAGKKTFADNVYFVKAAPALYLQFSDLQKGDAPASNTYASVNIYDKNGIRDANTIAGFWTRVRADKSIETALTAREPIAGSTGEAQLTVRYFADGTMWATAPTTPSGSTSNQIVTANYANNTYLAKSGGTLTGSIKRTGALVELDNQSGAVSISGGPVSDGICSALHIYGRSHSTEPGTVQLISSKEGARTDVILRTDGRLTVGGKNIVRSVNGVNADDAGNVAITAVPTGSVIAFAANSNPSGFLLCNGAAVSRTTYATLFSTIGTTYGAGDGSTTFHLPNLTDRVIQGHSTAGAYRNAGLPNIWGDTGYNINRANNQYEPQGAFYVGNVSARRPATDLGTYANALQFVASNSSGVYGASSTVQPAALTMRYYIKY